jgi:hypothetical protein
MAREGVDEEGYGLPVAGNVDAGVPGLLEDEPLDDGEQDPGEASGKCAEPSMTPWCT